MQFSIPEKYIIFVSKCPEKLAATTPLTHKGSPVFWNSTNFWNMTKIDIKNSQQHIIEPVRVNYEMSKKYPRIIR